MRKLDEHRLSLTENVKTQLASEGIDERIDSLKSLKTSGGHTSLEANTTIRDAYNELMSKTEGLLQGAEEKFKSYKQDIEEKNKARNDLYLIFNSEEKLPLPMPINDNVLVVDIPELDWKKNLNLQPV